ncbi:MAG: GNAT family N-acetyltransferase [Pseudomonadota bacterium]
MIRSLNMRTDRLSLHALAPQHATALHAYYTRNAAHLAPWEPRRPDGYHDLEAWEARVAVQCRDQAEGRRLSVLAFEGATLVAIANFNGLERGVSRSCTLGYSCDGHAAGQGFMTEVLAAVIPEVFAQGYTRIAAAYLPENHRSARLLHRLGFEREGFARDYLKIAGRWRDHVLTSKRAPHR